MSAHLAGNRNAIDEELPRYGTDDCILLSTHNLL